jgi:type I restriction enzyme S subunit
MSAPTITTREWETKPFSEVVDILDSRRIPVNSEERAKRVGDVPYYGATGQVGFIDKHIFDEELVLLGEDGAPFLDSGKSKAYMIRGKSWVNNHAHVLRGKPGLSNSFLLYQLNNLDYRPYVSGTTRLKLPQGPMKRIPLLVPLEDEQRRIVAEIEKQFTRLDAGVRALRRVQANLKRYRAAVLKAACEGRLVPTEAELAKAENRKFETGEGLLSRVLTQRQQKWNGRGQYKEPATLDKAKLFQLPGGWTWTTLDALAEIKGGITKDQNRKHTAPVRSVPYLRVANVQRGYLDLTEVKEIVTTEDEIQELALSSGDILFNEGGDRDKLGRGWVWNGELPECIHQNHVFRARLHVSELNPKFVSWYANTFGQQFFFDEGKHTTNLASISMTKLKGLPVPIPPPAEQTRIVAEVERRLSAVDELAAVVSTNLRRAARLQQSILQLAFNGNLKS